MSEGEKKALWVIGPIVAIVILWIFLARRAPVQIGSTAPNYLTYNYPNVALPSGSATGLPSVTLPTSSSCGCSSGTSGFFTSLNQMLATFQQGASNAFQSYQNNVVSAFPSSVTQYFNNPVGAAQSAAAQQTFLQG